MPTVTTLLVPIPELYLHLLMKQLKVLVLQLTVYQTIPPFVFLCFIYKVEDQALITSDLNCDVVGNLIEMGSGQATYTIFNKDNPIG